MVDSIDPSQCATVRKLTVRASPFRVCSNICLELRAGLEMLHKAVCMLEFYWVTYPNPS